MNNTAVPFK